MGIPVYIRNLVICMVPGPAEAFSKWGGRAPKTREILGGTGACSHRKFENPESLKCHFLDFKEFSRL